MTKYIAIDGMSGSGKTYLSGLLSNKLNTEIFHLDEYGNDFQPFVGLPKLLDIVKQSKAETVLYEGVGVFDEKFDILKPYKILAKSNGNIRNERMYDRDILNPKHTKDEWSQIGKIWKDAENNYFNEFLDDKADLIIENNDNLDVDLMISKL